MTCLVVSWQIMSYHVVFGVVLGESPWQDTRPVRFFLASILLCRAVKRHLIS